MEFLDFLTDPSVPVALIEIVVGLVLLSKAADVFVDGAAEVATAAKMSPVVIGAVVIGFGTSAPELLVSGFAAAGGEVVNDAGEVVNGLDLALGNIVGSNVANVSLVLGVAALIIPIAVTREVITHEAPLSLGAVCLFAFFSLGGLAVWEGVVMLVVLVIVLSWIIFGGHEHSAEEEVGAESERTVLQSLGVTVVGLVGTVIGAYLMVWGSTAVAGALGLSGGFVGFTLIALGTSLPELVTTFAASRKGETELIMGNLLGSNMFNSLAVGGVAAVVGAGQFRDEIPATYGVGIMVIIALLTTIFMLTRRKITRVEGSVLLAGYVFAILLIEEDLGIGDALRGVVEAIF